MPLNVFQMPLQDSSGSQNWIKRYRHTHLFTLLFTFQGADSEAFGLFKLAWDKA